MGDWNNDFAKRYKEKNAKTKALHKLQHSKVKTEAGTINILRLGNEH